MFQRHGVVITSWQPAQICQLFDLFALATLSEMFLKF